MKTSEIYEACIPLLEKEQFKYICHAIEYAQGREYTGRQEDKCEIILDLERRLSGEHTLSSFVHTMRTFSSPYPEEEMLYLRIETCKSLAKEFKAKGD